MGVEPASSRRTNAAFTAQPNYADIINSLALYNLDSFSSCGDSIGLIISTHASTNYLSTFYCFNLADYHSNAACYNYWGSLNTVDSLHRIDCNTVGLDDWVVGLIESCQAVADSFQAVADNFQAAVENFRTACAAASMLKYNTCCF